MQTTLLMSLMSTCGPPAFSGFGNKWLTHNWSLTCVVLFHFYIKAWVWKSLRPAVSSIALVEQTFSWRKSSKAIWSVSASRRNAPMRRPGRFSPTHNSWSVSRYQQKHWKCHNTWYQILLLSEVKVVT